jgi:hypothetical protein
MHYSKLRQDYCIVMLCFSVDDKQEGGLEYVFEGVKHNSLVDHVVPHFDMESVNPRLQLSTDDSNVRDEYSSLYEEQLRNIIEGYEVMPGEEGPIAWTSTIEERKKSKRAPTNRTGLQLPVQRAKGLFPPSSESASCNNWKGDVSITYPPNLTRLLRTPMSKTQCLAENVLFVTESKKTGTFAERFVPKYRLSLGSWRC